MLLFRNQLTADSDSFFNVPSNVSLFLNANEVVLSPPDYKYQNYLTPLASH